MVKKDGFLDSVFGFEEIHILTKIPAEICEVGVKNLTKYGFIALEEKGARLLGK